MLLEGNLHSAYHLIYTKCYFVIAKESSYLSRLGVDIWQSYRVCCELFSDVLEMEPDFTTGITYVFPLSRSAFMNLFLVAFQIPIAFERLVALITLMWFLVDMCFFVAL